MRENETKNFWLQLVNDFYDSDRMLYLESMPGGQAYSHFYTKLLLKSVRTGGVLRLSEKVAYNEYMLASFTRMPLNTVHEAMEQLMLLDLVEIWEDGTIFLPELEGMVGSETIWAGKKRKVREKKQSCEDNVPEECENCEDNVLEECENREDNVPRNKRKETKNKIHNNKEEKNKEDAPEGAHTRPVKKADEKNKYGEYGWVRLTDREYTQLLDELGEAELARCVAYVDQSAQGTGNRNRWQDWALVLRRCSRESWGRQQEERRKPREDITQSAARGQSEENGGEAMLDDYNRMKAYLDELKTR